MVRRQKANRILQVFKGYSKKEKLWTLFFAFLFLISFFNLFFFSASSESPGDLPIVKGIYTEGVVGSVRSLNPVFSDLNEVERDVSRLIFSGLMKYDAVSGNFVNDLGQLTLSSDKLTYTFVLRDDVKWHDGQAFRADDVYFTYHDVIQSEDFANPVLKANFNGIDINQIDEKTIQFVLDAPNSFFVTNLSTGILPKHILDEVPVGEILQAPFNQKPVGTGPYMMEDAVKILSDERGEIALRVFPDYYDTNPTLGHVRIFTFPNMVALTNEKNALNGVVKLSGQDATLFQGDSRFTLKQYTFPQYTAIFMNMDRDALKLRGVRLALIKSVPKDGIKNLLPDKELVDTPLLELKQDDWVYQYSKEEAQGALYEAGYKYPDGDQSKTRQNDNSEPLSLELLVRDYTTPRQIQEIDKLSKFLVEKWGEVGMEVKVVKAPLDVYLSRLQNRDYDLVLAGQSLGYNYDTYSFWHSTQVGSSGLNLSNYKSFAVDALIADIRSEFNNDLKAKKLKQLAETIRDDFPAFFLYRPIYYYATDGKVTGLNLENMSFTADRFSNVSQWVLQ